MHGAGVLVSLPSLSDTMLQLAFAHHTDPYRYGGTLLASYEYNITDFFIIYMAIVQGAVAAGMWFSFAPSMHSTHPNLSKLTVIKQISPRLRSLLIVFSVCVLQVKLLLLPMRPSQTTPLASRSTSVLSTSPTARDPLPSSTTSTYLFSPDNLLLLSEPLAAENRLPFLFSNVSTTLLRAELSTMGRISPLWIQMSTARILVS